MSTDPKHSITQFKNIRSYLNEHYYEREEVIFASMASVIAGEHMLLLGPPGTGKTKILDDFCNFIRDVVFFSWLLTKNCTVDEILGPYDEREKEYGVFKRLTKNKLPEANIAFLDEIWKAKGDTLNALLSALNERTFFQEGEPTPIPLISLFGASNEYPEESSLVALYDRFLIRMNVNYLKSEDNLRRMLSPKQSEDAPLTSLSLNDVKVMQHKSKCVTISDSIINSLISLRINLFNHHIHPSDRRLNASRKLLQASAVLNERKEVTWEDLSILKYVLWNHPTEQELAFNFVAEEMEKLKSLDQSN